ncbi:RNA polymerase sigma factor [Streptomyces sp. NPDC050564]|uniref:RNA polymerase sigma factor n=1 Tax=Streptomyces sp. NPDC050564 TaxID=3365631 RepID=UPI0037A4870B
MGFSAPRRGFLGLLGPARAKQRESVEKIMEGLEKQSATYKNIILTRIDQRYVDDVWGEAQVRMTAHLRAGHRVKNPAAYMTRVCINCAYDELEKIRKGAEDLIGDDDTGVLERTDVPLDDSGLMYSDVKTIMAEVLTPRDHRAYVLRFVYGLNAKEIAEVLDWTHDCVRQALVRADRILNRPEVKRRFRYRPRSSER